MSKNGVKHRVSVALTVQKYNREIAVYEFLGDFFSGEWKFLSAVKEGGVMSVIKVKCH